MSVRTVDTLISRGTVVAAEQRGLYQTLPSIVGYLEDLRGKAAGRSGDSMLAEKRAKMLDSQQEVVDLRRRRELIEVAKLEKTVLAVDDVVAGWSAILQRIKSDLLALPSQLRAQVPHLGAHGQEMAKTLIRDVLKDMAEDIENGAIIGGAADTGEDEE